MTCVRAVCTCIHANHVIAREIAQMAFRPSPNRAILGVQTDESLRLSRYSSHLPNFTPVLSSALSLLTIVVLNGFASVGWSKSRTFTAAGFALVLLTNCVQQAFALSEIGNMNRGNERAG